MKQTKSIVQTDFFHEKQRFRQAWLWAIIAIPVVISLYFLTYQILLGKSIGDRPMPDWMVILFVLIFGLALPVSLYTAELRIKVTKDGLHVKFFPIHRKWLLFSPIEIEKFELRQYRPVVDYGGWGIKNGIAGKAYSISGNKGVYLTLLNDEHLLIGTQKPEELLCALKKMKND